MVPANLCLLLLLAGAAGADLAARVEDCLDRLVLADRAFWVDQLVFNITRPEQLVRLYHHRSVSVPIHF